MFGVIIGLIVLAAIFKAVMDKLRFHFETSIFRGLGKWWNPAISWELKWKNNQPQQGERFWLSSTILAWTTDAWHFFQMLFLSCWQLALALLLGHNWLTCLIWFLILKTVFSFAFEVAFSKVFRKR